MGTPAFNPNADYAPSGAPQFDPTASYQSAPSSQNTGSTLSGTAPWQQAIDTAAQTEPYSADKGIWGNTKAAIGNLGAGATQLMLEPIAHPLKTVQGIFTPPPSPAEVLKATPVPWGQAAADATAAAPGAALAVAGMEPAGQAVSNAAKGTGQLAGRAALLGRTPEGAYESALKPSTTIPAAQRATMVQTGLENAIPVSKTGLQDIANLIDRYNQQIEAKINSAGPNRTINPGAAVQNLQSVRNKFATQVNPQADLTAIDNSQNEFLNQFRSTPGGAVRNMSAADAQAMKQGTYRVLAGKYGEQGSAAVEAQKALARGLKDEIANQFPEINSLNAAEGKLLDLQPVLERAINRNANHQLIGIGTPVASAATTAVTGSSGVGAVAGLMKAVLDNPMVKSRLAISVSKGAKIPYSQAYSRVQSWTAALGSSSAIAQASSADQTPSQ